MRDAARPMLKAFAWPKGNDVPGTQFHAIPFLRRAMMCREGDQDLARPRRETRDARQVLLAGEQSHMRQQDGRQTHSKCAWTCENRADAHYPGDGPKIVRIGVNRRARLERNTATSTISLTPPPTCRVGSAPI